MRFNFLFGIDATAFGCCHRTPLALFSWRKRHQLLLLLLLRRRRRRRLHDEIFHLFFCVDFSNNKNADQTSPYFDYYGVKRL